MSAVAEKPMTTSNPEMDSDLSLDQYAAVSELRAQLGRKFEVSDLITGEYRGDLADLAHSYVRTYRGHFEFVQDVTRSYHKYGYLTEAQAKGILNTIVAEYRRYLDRQEEKQTFEVDLTRVPAPEKKPQPTLLHSGRFTLVKPDGTYRTFRIKDVDVSRYDKPEGTRMLMFLSGPDNETAYTGFAWLFADGRIQVWSRFRTDGELAEDAQSLVNLNRDGIAKATQMYALASGSCAICGRTLTVPASINRGIGPECAKKTW